jgi:hypothetical protein
MKRLLSPKEKRIREQAEQNVLAVRGTYDAPGFEACVDAEIRRLENEDRN